MKLTEQQIKAKSNDKVNAIQVLCRQLEVEISAEQMITPQGFIKQVVYYTDTEKYETIEEGVNEDQQKLPLNNKSNDENYDEKTPTGDVPDTKNEDPGATSEA